MTSLHVLRALVPCLQPLLIIGKLLLRDIFPDAVDAAFKDLVWKVTRSELALEVCDLHQILLVE